MIVKGKRNKRIRNRRGIMVKEKKRKIRNGKNKNRVRKE